MATEATRKATNSADFLREIEEKVGWRPDLLSKEDEGRLGVMGVASSLSFEGEGLVMDLGGGSVQLTWMIKTRDGNVETGPFVSLPYGAAALMLQVKNFKDEKSEDALIDQIASEVRSSLEHLNVPESLKSSGYKLFLSGGGFRGWGHILMSLDKVQPYPIPIVNGYKARGSDFLPQLGDRNIASMSHRVSKRRASQAPAVQLLINSLHRAFAPIEISEVVFCQGGVREGILYSDLALSVRSEDALVAATLPFAPPSASALAALMHSAIPQTPAIRPSILTATTNLMYAHASLPKDIRAAAALRCTTTGLLANVHGLDHTSRAILALILCERWGGEADVPLSDLGFLDTMKALCRQPQSTFMAKYIGRMAKGIASVYPAGIIRAGGAAISIDALSERGAVDVKIVRPDVKSAVRDWKKDVRKLVQQSGESVGAGNDLRGLNLVVTFDGR